MEVRPPERLVFTLGWERAAVRATDSLVTVEFAEHGGETEVVITHERLHNRPLRGLHRAGWRHTLRRLGELLGA